MRKNNDFFFLSFVYSKNRVFFELPSLSKPPVCILPILFNCVTLCITQRYGTKHAHFKNAWFERFARKNRISDKALREVVELADKGLISADLGSGVIKQRLARRGGGKSGGYRTIIFYRVAEKAFSSMRTQRMREKILQPSRKTHFEKLRITFSILLMNNWRN